MNRQTSTSSRGQTLKNAVGAVVLSMACIIGTGAAWADGGPTSTITRTSSFTYDSSTGLLTSETVEPTASDCNGSGAPTSSCAVTTTYTYDSFGNKQTATVSGAGITSRATTTNYDPSGQFNTSSSNALNQSESWQYDARFGLPTSHTGPNGLTTTWSYDTFGRVTQETRPDGTITKYTYINCATAGGCVTGAATAQTATAYAPGGSTAISPTTTSYYDSLSRKIAVTTQGFDGSVIEADIQYDANGRVARTSRPYFQSGGTPKWTINTYDTIGRVTHVALPNGGSIDTTYHGLTVSVTNDHNQTTTTVKNAEGEVASVTDAAGHTTNYSYDAEGDLVSVTDPYSNVTTNTYDRRGHKIASSDPDMGTWTYAYDVLGELVSQTDAKGQTTTVAYDLLGRVTSRSEADQVSTWTYDSAAKGVGKLAEAKACTSAGCGSVVSDKTFTYDSLGRPSTATTTVGGTAYTYTQSYDGDGRPSTVQYPSGTTIQYVYTALGYVSQVKDASSGTAYWTANARDAELHPVSQTFGNGITQSNTYDPNTGFLTNVRAGPSDQVAAFDYTYDTLGNLTYRSDNVEGTFEYACYDNLNRLTQYAVGNGVTACTSAQNNKVVTYDALGNITSKTGIGAYNYNATGSVRPHAVASIAGTVDGVVNPAYSYDADGNMTSGGGRTVSWTSFNMVASITQGTTSVGFSYDSEHQRVQQTLNVNGTITTTTYVNDAASGAMEDKAVTGSSVTWHDYILAEGHIVAEKFSGATSATRYFILDHLSSVAVVTDESGKVVERLAYDAWGKRRNLDGSDDTSCSLTSQTTHGFTNQEEIDAMCLVNLNARLYDPNIGRFLSPDPTTEAPFNLQDLNRYSYVGNNPLSFVDPSGLCFLGCFWKNPIVVAIIGVAIAIVVPLAIYGFSFSALQAGLGAGEFAAIGGSALGGALSGAVTAGLSGGNILEGALFGGLSGAAFAGIVPTLGNDIAGALGTVFGPKFAGYAGYFLASGFVGGGLSAAEGGNFGTGFLAAGIGSLAGPLTGGGFSVQGTVLSAVLGGAASVLGGGKFANGAVTGAFAYAATALAAGDAGHSGSGVRGPQYASNGGCDCETVNVSASRTYYFGLDFEFTAIWGGEVYFGIYYNADFLKQNKPPTGLFGGGGPKHGLAIGASLIGGATPGPFSNFEGFHDSTTISWDQVSVSTDGTSGGYTLKGLGPKFGASWGTTDTATAPAYVRIPDKVMGIPLQPIPF